MARSRCVLVDALVVLVALTCLNEVAAVDFGFGACPAKNVVENFNVTRYMGKWYEVERYWQIFELDGKCVTAEYSLDAASGKIAVKNSMTNSRSSKESSIEGSAVLADKTASPVEAKLTVTFRVPVVGERSAPYWVLDTDYDNYALVYSCSTILGLVRTESAWIMSRTPAVADPAVQQAVEDAITKGELSRSSFLKTVQDCSN